MLDKNAVSIIIVLIVLLAFTMSMFISDPKNYDNSRLKIFITIVAGFGIFVIFFFYLNVVELQYNQQKMIFHDRIQSMDDNVLDNFIKSLESNFEKEPTFIMSILPLQYPEASNIITGTQSITKYNTSFKIFSLWRDYINYHNYLVIVNDDKSYIVQFLQRCNSLELKEYWKTMKLNYSITTKEFGDLLFEYGQNVEKTSEAYCIKASQLVVDKRYIELMKIVDNIYI